MKRVILNMQYGSASGVSAVHYCTPGGNDAQMALRLGLPWPDGADLATGFAKAFDMVDHRILLGGLPRLDSPISLLNRLLPSFATRKTR